jgi:threonine/homoserine/homoserine lactone efflux protein
MSLILEGIAVGLSIAAPVGAIGFLCIQQTLLGGIQLGIACGLGAATADMIYGLLVALGLKAFQSILLAYKTPLTLIGGLFIVYLGLRKFFSVPTIKEGRADSRSLFSAYVTTFFLTLTNPATILDFMALFTGLSIDVSGYVQSVTFVGGVFLGSALWWFLLCFAVGLFRKRVSVQALRYINYGAGIAICSFGIYALSKLWK